jgi:hypothetical protein
MLTALIPPLLFYSLLNAGDLASTEYVLSHGGYEANWMGQTLGARIALKVVSSAVFTLADYGFQRVEKTSYSQRKSAKIGKWVLRGGALLMYGLVTYHNLNAR